MINHLALGVPLFMETHPSDHENSARRAPDTCLGSYRRAGRGWIVQLKRLVQRHCAMYSTSSWCGQEHAAQRQKLVILGIPMMFASLMMFLWKLKEHGKRQRATGALCSSVEVQNSQSLRHLEVAEQTEGRKGAVNWKRNHGQSCLILMKLKGRSTKNHMVQ